MAAPLETNSGSEKPVLEPLLLPSLEQASGFGRSSPVSCLPCLMCGETFEITVDKVDFLKHLLSVHKLVVADVNLIANFKSYILYWKERLKEVTLKEVCSSIETTGAGDSGQYYLLSDVLPEDKQLREFLQKRKLECALEQQQLERDDSSFSRGCLFCREHFTGNRALMFNHMAESHSFNVGQPDNLVYTDEFLDILQQKLTSLQCLYCEKTFRDRTVLKEHMRKKQHRKINPKNTSYDRFYIINYLELGKNWEKIQHERDIVIDSELTDTESEDEWSGWEEQSSGQAVCLYCDFSSSNPDKLLQHMQELHDLDLQEIKLRHNLNFYQQVKLINYIGRQVHLGICIGCGEKFNSKTELTDHMHEANHTNSIPDIQVWDQPQYFFPTYENDNLLCQLDDTDDLDPSGSHSNQVNVIAEDLPHIDTILTEEGLRREILSS